MRRYIISCIILFVFVCCGGVKCWAYKILEDTTIVESIKDGLKIIRSCTVRFDNIGDIDIGDSDNTCAGIEIEPGVTLTIDVSSHGNVNIHGGYYFKDGNEYNCAGIHVPPKAMLVIDNSGKGKLVVYPFDRGAGIGGSGVLIENFQNSINCHDAGKVIIKRGNVLIERPVDYSGFARGAGIGGGGICNINNDMRFLCGGVLDTFHMMNGELTIMLNERVNSCGEGAGIGGGGIANLNDRVDNIQGGNAANVIIDRGKINVRNEMNEGRKGIGSAIGGGGVYNIADACIISKGELLTLKDMHKAKIQCDGVGVYGDGSVYNKGSVVEPSMQKRNVRTYVDNYRSWFTRKMVGVGVVVSAAFMVFELVT